MLNSYFTEMYEQIVNHKGILDKYIGDAIMAVFGTPFPSPDDADNSLQSAIGIYALKTFNALRVKDNRSHFNWDWGQYRRSCCW